MKRGKAHNPKVLKDNNFSVPAEVTKKKVG